jgi:hypothetical protein
MAPVYIHIERAIRIALAKHPITIGRHAQLLDLFFEGVDLVLGLLQGSDEPFVLFLPLRQLLQGLMVLAFQAS